MFERAALVAALAAFGAVPTFAQSLPGLPSGGGSARRIIGADDPRMSSTELHWTSSRVWRVVFMARHFPVSHARFAFRRSRAM